MFLTFLDRRFNGHHFDEYNPSPSATSPKKSHRQRLT
jgi:hypothetical protein